MLKLTTISAERDSICVYFRKFWQYRTLILTFAQRDIKIKYAQTHLGVVWVLLQPLPTILIFTFFFNTLIKVNTSSLPYPIFALAGMIGWNYFNNITSSIGSSLIESKHILKKIYFPKLILPLSKLLVATVDFLVSFAFIVVAMLFFSVQPTWKIIFFPLFFFFNIITGIGVGIWVAALTFRYRDFQNIAPTIIGFCIWLTPVFYPTTLLPKQFALLMHLNPIALVIEGYRFTLAGDKSPSLYYLISIIPVLLLLVFGLWYFRKIEDDIIDFI